MAAGAGPPGLAAPARRAPRRDGRRVDRTHSRHRAPRARLGQAEGLQPASAAAGYGVPAGPGGDAGAGLTIKGLRDGTLGRAGLALRAFAGAGAEAWFMLAVPLVPLVFAV
ncbi:hypothetical protein GCM10017668_50010 [Streptomyces tuirus]|uniref:Uncharacterized protein n=1 Tax=Streptomyces tuirus TaxID=68278 RepID=A0A7G1NJ18_9ACTN|nr:hypothetical protein [Streptomyces tuirus]BCL23158.1 hypothetical protein GCM10017668_50010 [Streptomyces tuirus]